MQRLAIALAVLLGICLTLIAVPARAQSPVVTAGPYQTSFGVRCHDGQCSLSADLGAGEVDVAVPAETPLKFDLPAGDLGLLSGAAVEIADKLTLSLPVGEIQMPEGAFDVELDEAGEIHTLHGAADSILPNLALPYDIHIGGNFATEFGYDFGAELGDVGALLDPEQRYFFLRVGDGFTFDTSLADENGRNKPITLAVPDNESATLVIDPRSQTLYLDGRFNLSQVLRLATLAASLGIDVQQLPVLTGLVLPLRSHVGVAALLSPEPGRNFLEFSGSLGIEGGPLAQLIRLGDEPLSLDSSMRLDRSGIKLQGVVGTELMPDTVLDSGGSVEFFVPFGPLRDAYVRIGGELSLPVIGLAGEGEFQLGGRNSEDGATVADGPPWWGRASNWIGGTASSAASGVAGGTQASLEVLQVLVDVARSGAVGGANMVAGGASTTAGAVVGGASAAAGAFAGGVSTVAGVVADGVSSAAGVVADGASSAAGVVTGGASSAAGAVADRISSGADAVAGGASSVAGAAGDVAGSAWSGAASGATCGVSRAQQLWCRTTGLCEVPEDACAAEGGE